MNNNQLLKNEQGDTNFVSIIVILAIVLIAVLLFRSEVISLFK